MNNKQTKIIDKYFYYKNKNGEKFLGYSGFKRLIFSKYHTQMMFNNFLEIENRKKQNTFGLFGITTKVHKNFSENKNLDNVFVLENYIFTNKRKSLASYYMFLAKEKSNIWAIDYFVFKLYHKFKELNTFYNFDYIGFLESSNKNRKIQIMDVIKKFFIENLDLNKIKLLEISKEKTYLEQKKILNLEGRIKNANNSFRVGKIEKQNSNILLIDDVIDSRATLNSIATKIRDKNNVNQIIGFGGIGSLEGEIKITDI